MQRSVAPPFQQHKMRHDRGSEALVRPTATIYKIMQLSSLWMRCTPRATTFRFNPCLLSSRDSGFNQWSNGSSSTRSRCKPIITPLHAKHLIPKSLFVSLIIQIMLISSRVDCTSSVRDVDCRTKISMTF